MSDVFFPPNLVPSKMSWSLDDFTAADESAVTGATQTSELYGTRRWRCRMDFDLLDSRDGTLQAYDGFIASLRGRARRVWVKDYARRQRGSFSAPEMFANPTFENGTTGWSASNANLTAPSRRIRVSPTLVGTEASFQQSVSGLTQYAPYALRSFILDGPQTSGLLVGRFISDGGSNSSDYSTSRGLGTLARVALSAAPGSQFPAVIASSSGFTVGAYVDVPYTSLARCALVDGGSNAALYSNTIGNAAWTKSALTATDNVHLGPSGIADLANLVETTATGQHYVSQSISRTSVAEDLCAFGVFCRNGSPARDVRIVVGSGGSDYAACIFDLWSGTPGAVTLVGGVTNGRAFSVNLGNDRFACYLVARCPASTSIFNEFDMVSGGSVVYTGTTGAIGAGYLGVARTSTPVRLTKTTTTAAAASTQSGTGIYLKGLLASTSGLLLPGDPVEIQGERKRVIAPLDTDAAGHGYLQFEPHMKAAAADNAPVIIHDPLCRMRLAESNVGVEYAPGIFGQASLELVEA